MSRYIANGTEGTMWMAGNCERCARDHDCHDENDDASYGNGCEVVLGLMADLYPLEGLVEHAGRHMPERLQCTYWCACVACGVDPADVPASWRVKSGEL